MPSYPYLFDYDMDLSTLNARVKTLAGFPMYTPKSTTWPGADAVEQAQNQAQFIADGLRKRLEGGVQFAAPEGLKAGKVWKIKKSSP